MNKCSNDKEEIIVDEVAVVSGELDNSNSNISGVRVTEGTTYQDNESGLIITVAKAWDGQIDCNYVAPSGEKGHDYIVIGEGFGFIGSNNKSYDVILLSTNEDKYAVFSIKEGNRFNQKIIKEDVEEYANDFESNSLKKGDTLDEGDLNILIENIDLENQKVAVKCVLGDVTNNLQLEVGKIHKFKHEGKYYKFKVTKIEDEYGDSICKIHYWTPNLF